ncbi:Acidic phosphoprotein precursor PCEMA1, putative [Plasmodium chabaudi chabaudi]|uniref:Acidic phosphoprotein PCEMA1, putative n=1 Tax=Plasmodium chabaudi chabaudi TaxID=31271 RepID=A0A1D3L9G5_PLACU|nr:Acidic phosphoprotein precursor PCEMA1, putative [Plasmodium chabaudi chabaudi]
MNKGYIKIVLFLLSILVYVDNETLATELVPEENTTPELTDLSLTSEEINEKKEDILCTDPKETKEAIELMNEAVKHLEIHATDMHKYMLCRSDRFSDTTLYKKKLENNTDVEKVEYSVYCLDKHNEIINEIWNPDQPNPFNNGDVKIVRVYNPNLVIIQQRYKKKTGSPQKYFYALATKVQISENTTIIAYTSANINDHNPSKKKYENKIIQKANSFKININSEEDIRKGKVKKTFVNLAGYHIQNQRNGANITYIESIDGHTSIKPRCLLGRCYNSYYLNI